MRLFRSLDELPEFQNLVVTQGTFDGVHRGHVQVLQQVVEQAAAIGGESMLITFYPHPRMVLYPNENKLHLLNTIEEKAELMHKAGIENILVLPFTDEISKLTPLDFVRNILVNKLKVKKMIVGHDHRFGKNREGGLRELQQFGEMFNFEVDEIPAWQIEELAVSSTRIRTALLEGRIEEANELLGRPYSFTGTVVHGKKLGREIGFPTANIEVFDPYKLIPADGVYAVTCKIGVDKFKAAMNIGWNPTIEGKGHTIEAHLFDFSGDLYDIAIPFELIARIRDEEKFQNVEELTQRIRQDVEQAKIALQHL